jgi:phosphoribosylaminoimidazole carboxylase PurE protein
MKKNKQLVGIVMGSDSDFPILAEALQVLDSFSVPYEVIVSSAHRSPARTSEYSRTAVSRGIEVIIVGAGSAAHLAGVIASETPLPVIGIPIDSSPLNGIDALLSTVQMPAGVPVATLAIGKAGARNAAIFAVTILSLKDTGLRKKLMSFRSELAAQVEKKSQELQKKLNSLKQ